MGELDRTETATPDDVVEGEPERLGSGLGPKRPPEAKDVSHARYYRTTVLLRGTIVNRTYGTHKNQYNSLF